ncbi:MAG TPA: hypothetical protein DER01_17140 [Phycisphaerales bacterium]|nr:hypothetical protein [Phycisphaerales bacterium]
MNQTNPKVDGFLRKAKLWQEELTQLRAILLDCQLTEDVKWRQPCYMFEQSNIAILGGFKEYCALSFFKGALLKDPNGILTQPGENTQAARLIRFTSVQQIIECKHIIKAYILQAIEVEKAGLKVELKKDDALDIPDELKTQFDQNPALKTAFNKLTPGRQRGYLLFITAVKQSKTRTARIEKYTPQILDDKGFNDCTCGLSKKMPNCDGSHKSLK